MSNDVTYANSYQDSIVAKWLDILSRESGYGTARGIHADILAGINARGFGTMLPHNNDHSGLTFFTRPRCNLSYDNLAASRVLSPLMTDKRMSYQAYIRDILDPVSVQKPGRKNCPLIDPRQAFIPIMSNLLMNVSGFPDIVSSCWTSNPGLYQEEYSLPDGPVKLYNTFDITCNFRNIDGDPLTGLFMAWREYYGLSYEGAILPHPDAIVEDEADFFTAIYRLVTNRDMTHVQKIARTIAYPISINIGSAFNYDVNTLRASENDQITVTFRCHGCEYMDPILLHEFNWCQELYFNPQLGDKTRKSNFVKLKKEEIMYYNFLAFPWINANPTDGETPGHALEWWVPKDLYAQFTSARTSTTDAGTALTSSYLAPYAANISTV